MNEKELFILVQNRGGSKNTPHSGGMLLTRISLFDAEYMSRIISDNSIMIKYASIGNYFQDFKQMTIGEFTEYFSEDAIAHLGHILNYNSREGFSKTLFSEKIHRAYGRDTASNTNLRCLKQSELIVGGIYLSAVRDIEYLYLGKASLKYKYSRVYGEREGFLFIDRKSLEPIMECLFNKSGLSYASDYNLVFQQAICEYLSRVIRSDKRDSSLSSLMPVKIKRVVKKTSNIHINFDNTIDNILTHSFSSLLSSSADSVLELKFI